MQHDVSRKGIAYGLHTSLGVESPAYCTELAEQIMYGQFHKPRFAFVNIASYVGIPYPFVGVHGSFAITTAHEQIQIGIQVNAERQRSGQAEGVEEIYLTEGLKSFLCGGETLPIG